MNGEIVKILLLSIMIIIGLCFLPSSIMRKLEEVITKLDRIEIHLQTLNEIFKEGEGQ